MVSATKKIGRPATGIGTPVQVRVQPDLLADLEKFIASEPDPKPSRPDAIRRLLSDALIGLGLRKVQ
jgi:hypothetical protein